MGPIAAQPRFRKSVFKEHFEPDPFHHTCTFPRTVSSSVVCPSVEIQSTTSGDTRPDGSLSTRFVDDLLKSSGTTMISSKYLPSKLLMLACTLLITFSLIFETPCLTIRRPNAFGATAGVIQRRDASETTRSDTKLLAARADTQTDACTRWSQQSALVNGTIYVYGGHRTTEQGQQQNTWSNDFLTIDVTKSWDIASPALKGLPQPSGPPPVANGYLWSSHDALYLYGGIYSDSPPTTPTEFSLWSYDIKSASWTEHKSPKTSAGKNSGPADAPVQRAGEGAGISVPELGRGWYFAGHLDEFTTPGWSNQVPRAYLKSLIEYTFPSVSNDQVDSLGGGKTAGQDGVWRNITEGGIQDTAQFPIRADSALVYVPGYGAQGILVNTGGGTDKSFVSQHS